MQKNSICRCPKVGKFFKTERLRQGSIESTLEGTKGTSKKGMSLINVPSCKQRQAQIASLSVLICGWWFSRDAKHLQWHTKMCLCPV